MTKAPLSDDPGGLRKLEATGLLVENIFLERSMMIVRGKDNKQQVVPVVDQLRPYIEKRLSETKNGLMWPTRTENENTDLKKIIKLAKERSGLMRHIYPHLLRHVFWDACYHVWCRYEITSKHNGTCFGEDYRNIYNIIQGSGH